MILTFTVFSDLTVNARNGTAQQDMLPRKKEGGRVSPAT
jgi:hypothetical protein